MKEKYKIKDIEFLPIDELANLPIEYLKDIPEYQQKNLIEHFKNQYKYLKERENDGSLPSFLIEKALHSYKKGGKATVSSYDNFGEWHKYIRHQFDIIFSNIRDDELYQSNSKLYYYIKHKLIEKDFHDILLLLVSEVNGRINDKESYKDNFSDGIAKSACMYYYAKKVMDTETSTLFNVDANKGYWNNLSLNGYDAKVEKFSRFVGKIKKSFESNDDYIRKFSDFFKCKNDLALTNDKLMYMLNYYNINDGLERDEYIWLSIDPRLGNTISRYFPLYTYHCFSTVNTPMVRKNNNTKKIMKHLQYLVEKERRPSTPSLNDILLNFEQDERIAYFIRYNFKDFYEDLKINSNIDADLDEITMLTTCNRIAFEDRYPLQFYYSLNTDIVNELIDNTFTRKEIKDFYANPSMFDKCKMNVLESILNLSRFNINMRYVQKLIDESQDFANSKNYLQMVNIINSFIKEKYQKCINMTINCIDIFDNINDFDLLDILYASDQNYRSDFLTDLHFANYFSDSADCYIDTVNSLIKNVCRTIDNLSMKYKKQEADNNPILSKLLSGTDEEINELMNMQNSVHSEFANIRNNDKDYIYLLLLETYITK